MTALLLAALALTVRARACSARSDCTGSSCSGAGRSGAACSGAGRSGACCTQVDCTCAPPCARAFRSRGRCSSGQHDAVATLRGPGSMCSAGSERRRSGCRRSRSDKAEPRARTSPSCLMGRPARRRVVARRARRQAGVLLVVLCCAAGWAVQPRVRSARRCVAERAPRGHAGQATQRQGAEQPAHRGTGSVERVHQSRALAGLDERHGLREPEEHCARCVPESRGLGGSFT